MEQVYTRTPHRTLPGTVRTELIRKSIHLAVAIVPLLALTVGVVLTVAILAAGTLLYTVSELLRRDGYTVPIITRITELAARNRDRGHFVWGPVTLGVGAITVLVLFSEPAASVAILALAGGDSLSSLVGRFFGRVPLPGTGGKTLEGSLACFAAVAVTTAIVVGPSFDVLVIALAAAVLEALPTGDADNLVLPLGVAVVAAMIL